MDELRIIAPFHHPASGYAKAGRGLLAAALYAGICVEVIEGERNQVTSFGMDGKKRVSYVPRFDGSSIPEVQREELQAALGTRVSASAPTLIMGNPGSLADWKEYCAGPRIGFTMLEADRLAPLWAQAARNVDLLLAPSRWCLKTFLADVRGPIKGLLPICVDERLWSPEGARFLFTNAKQPVPPFLFLSVFSTCERKGWRKTIQAFAEEFRGEDCGLVLKPTRAAEVEELAEWARTMGVWVEVVKEKLTDEQMACLYRACDVYVSPSAEGFGVPLVEAALCGLPSVALDAGGSADIVTAGNGYPVASVWEPCIGQLPQIYPSTAQWPTCEIEPLKQAMRQAFEEKQANPDAFQLRRDMASAGNIYFDFCRSMVGSYLQELKIPEKVSVPKPDRRLHPLVAVITTHNHIDSTKRLVESLRDWTNGCSIVLADDGSTDGTAEWADAEWLLLIKCGGGNVSQNRQKAVDYIRKCPGSFPKDAFICFMDNDIEVSHGWWHQLHAILAEHPEIGILAPRKVYGDGTTTVYGSALEGSGIGGEVQNIGNGLHFNANSFPLKLERALVSPSYMESACMIVRAGVWRNISWDSAFPIFYEDADYCFQARAKGWDIAATNAVTVIHHAHTTSHSRKEESEKHRKLFLTKWKGSL